MQHPKDICECGDYRDQHVDGRGACLLNAPEGLGHNGAPNCERFRIVELYEASLHRKIQAEDDAEDRAAHS